MNYSGIVYSFYHELDSEYLNNLESRGVTPKYKDIKNGELVDFKGRNVREKRLKPLNEKEKIARSFVPKPTKVKPGYKKKMREEIKKISKKLYLAENKKRFYNSKKEK